MKTKNMAVNSFMEKQSIIKTVDLHTGFSIPFSNRWIFCGKSPESYKLIESWFLE